ncbi:MAG: hypothetical protein PHE43_00400 [Candidatus Nanoarchaeia archaeon]|nr:hypothetical protein [Candidatus Nanoarchaeia archaeon]
MNLQHKKGSIHWDTAGTMIVILVILLILILISIIFKDKMVEVIEKFKDLL